MSWPKFGLLIVVFAIVVFLLLSVIPGGASIQNAGLRIIEWCLNAMRFVVLLLFLFCGAFLLGLIIRVGIIDQIDLNIEKEHDMSGGQHLVISLLVGAIFAGLQVVVMNIVFHDNPDVRQAFAWIGLGGPFETPSVIFMGYGFLAGAFGYLAPSIEL